MKKVYQIPDMKIYEFKLSTDILGMSTGGDGDVGNDDGPSIASLDALNKGFKFQMDGGLGFGGPGFGWEE